MKYLILFATVSSISCAMEIVKKEPKRGIFIAIEGIDGSGKSTLAQHLHNALQQKYYNVQLTKEPGGTISGQKIRDIVHTQKTPLDPKAEFLLFAADRAQHFTEVIEPLLKQKYIIISDRWADSSLAYQGYGRGLDKDIINTVNTWAMNGRRPDFTIFVKISPTIALKRIKKRNNDISIFEKEYLLKEVAKGFEEIFSKYPSKYITVHGKESEEEVAQQTINTVQNWLQNDLKI